MITSQWTTISFSAI